VINKPLGFARRRNPMSFFKQDILTNKESMARKVAHLKYLIAVRKIILVVIPLRYGYDIVSHIISYSMFEDKYHQKLRIPKYLKEYYYEQILK